jgi:hypothetical protein
MCPDILTERALSKQTVAYRAQRVAPIFHDPRLISGAPVF